MLGAAVLVVALAGCTDSEPASDGDRGLVSDATMSTPRASGTATLLADGRVLLTGGYPGEGRARRLRRGLSVVRRVEVPSDDARPFRTVTAVGPDTVLVLGGYDADIVPTDAAYLVTVPG